MNTASKMFTYGSDGSITVSREADDDGERRSARRKSPTSWLKGR